MASVAFPHLRSRDYAGGSESGWGLNIARLFELLGHQIIVGKDFLRGRTKPDIVVLQGRFDLDSPQEWAEVYQPLGCSYLMMVFDPLRGGACGGVPAGVSLIAPFRACGTACKVVPYSYYEQRPSPRFENRTLGWTIRNPFDWAYGLWTDRHQMHLEHLRICRRLVQETGAGFTIFSDHLYPQSWEGLPPQVVEAHTILNELRRVGTAAQHVNYSQYLGLVARNSVLLPLDGLGSMTEGLKQGVVPLSFVQQVHIYAPPFGLGHYAAVRPDDIYSTLLRLLTEVEYYAQVFDFLFNRAAVYQIDEALSLARAALS